MSKTDVGHMSFANLPTLQFVRLLTAVNAPTSGAVFLLASLSPLGAVLRHPERGPERRSPPGLVLEGFLRELSRQVTPCPGLTAPHIAGP